MKYWLNAKHQFNQINPYSFIRIHLLLNTDSADFTDLRAVISILVEVYIV